MQVPQRCEPSQPVPPQRKHGDVDLDARLGEGEVAGPQAHARLLAEHLAGELEQHPLEVGERDVLVDREPLELPEHRHVRGVRSVGPVHAARHDDVDGRRLRLHRAHLHRRGVRAQQHALGQVEGVLRQPRRVLGRVVERREVVVVVLDLGALEDREAEPDEDVLHAPADLRDEVQVAGRERRVTGQRHVDAVLREAPVELGRLELLGALGELALERLPDLVRLLPDRAALLRRQLADRAQRGGQLRLAAEQPDAQLLELGRGRGRGDRRLAVGAELDQVRHGRASYARRRGGRSLPPSRR